MAPQSAALRPPPTSACQPWQGGGPRSTSGSSEVLSSPDLHSHPRPRSAGLGPTPGHKFLPQFRDPGSVPGAADTEQHESGWSPCHLCVSSNLHQCQDLSGGRHWAFPTGSSPQPAIGFVPTGNFITAWESSLAAAKLRHPASQTPPHQSSDSQNVPLALRLSLGDPGSQIESRSWLSSPSPCFFFL